MQNNSNLPEVKKGGALEFGLARSKPDGVDLACALVGSTTVTLAGFPASPPKETVWTHPDIHFVSAPASPLDLVPSMEKQVKGSRWIIAISVLCLCFFSFGIGVLAIGFKPPSMDLVSSPRAELGTWKITGVSAEGVILQTSEGPRIIPAGGMLPSGEHVLSLLPEKSAVVLSSGVLIITKTGGNNVGK